MEEKIHLLENLSSMGLEIQSEHPYRSGCWRDQAKHHLKRGCLPGSVGAKQAEDLASLNVEGDVIHCGELTEAFAQIADFDHRR